MKKIRPFLKWAGSKFCIIETILPTFPSSNRLIEPFTGSGAIFVNANYPAYVLAEENTDLINLYQYLQQDGETFIDYCEEFFVQKNNCANQYYQFRELFNNSTDTKLRSALFLYLNKHGYNGLCRYNQKGIFNVPFGRYIKPYFPRLEMLHFYQKSKLAKFIQADFRQTFSLTQPGDLIYCDPPYVPLSASANFSTYTNKKFTENDQIDLANLAIMSANKGATVIISNHDTAFTRHHYRHSKIVSFPVKRTISCNALKRTPVQELVAIFSKNQLIEDLA